MGKEKKEWLTNLANNVKARRKQLGFSQQLVAEKSRLSVGTVAKLEASAVDNPTLDTIEALGVALEEKDSLRLLRK
ncbi:MAG: helix-turn-helix domain-containing protein [Pseudobdellovibrio sp.]